MSYSSGEIEQKLSKAIDSLLKHDGFLLENNVNERSISHKLAEYLQKQFQGWNVDCEYNRKGEATKTLGGIENCSEEIRTDLVFPDIIVHRRNTKENLLVIEIKTNDQDPVCDIEKLKLFTSDENYKYDFGLFIKFNSTSKPDLRRFENGQEVLK